MTLPTTRQEFKDYLMRRIGYPVTEINVTEQQMQDRIDDALNFFYDYHYDGTVHTYLKHVVTSTDKTNEYITLPEYVVGVNRVFDIGEYSTSSGSNLFNIRYQISLNDLWDLSSTSIITYKMALTHLNLIEEVLVGKQPITYNKHMDRLHVHMNWNKVVAGNYILVDCHRKVDPSTYSDVYADRWLLEYATQLLKRQQGENLKKMSNVPLIGGITFNGQQIYDEANAKIEQMEEAAQYMNPLFDIIA